tara:strand:+ start:491 stop:856 length:366 start_codon:yes stop_codon:yes gene_type:complete
MKFSKKQLKEEIRKIIKEYSPDSPMGGSDSYDYVGMKTKGPYEEDDKEDEQFDQHFNIVPSPRARVSDIEAHKKVYSYLMGHPGAAMKMPLEDLMKKLDAGCPMSSAQALADYLADRAKLK